MRCSDIDLLRYAENGIGGWKALLIRAHIARCEDCRNRLANIQSAKANLTRALQQDLDIPNVVDSVMAMIKLEPIPSARLPRKAMAFRVAAVSVVAIITIAIFALNWPIIRNAPDKIVVKAPKYIILPHAPKPNMPEIVVHKPDLPREKRGPAARLHSGKIRVQVQIVKRPIMPEPCVAESANTDNSASKEQYCCVVVVTRTPTPQTIIDVESRNQITGAVTNYRKIIDEDGQEQVTESPDNTNLEDKRI
ncbi:MAG: hypothetical protein NT018_03085 [Armatimonadetes bacterium]|nr:hypothetical protein [Armatimonadota bacterium]